MQKTTLLPIYIFLVFILAGCDYPAKMTLNLSLYTEDLSSADNSDADYLDKIDIKKISHELSIIKKNIGTVTEQRENLADKNLRLVQNSCKEGITSDKNICDKYRTGKITDLKSEFTKKLKIKKKEAIDAINNAEFQVNLYEQSLDKYDKEDVKDFSKLLLNSDLVLKNLAEVDLKFKTLGGPLGTDYEKTIKVSTANINNTIPRLEYDIINSQVKTESKKVNHFGLSTENQQTTPNNIINEITEDIYDINKISVQLDNKAQILTETPLQVHTAQKTSLTDIVHASSLMNSQLYRIQDPADPLWREVLLSENSNKWQPVGNGTSAEAKGKVNIIMVQDSPIHYRIQQIHGDPSTMIESQLMIARTVGTTMLEIAQTASGVKLPNMSKSTKPNLEIGEQEEESSISVTQARLASLKTRYEAARQNLLTSLIALNAELNAANETSAIRKANDKVNGALKAFMTQFEQLANN